MNIMKKITISLLALLVIIFSIIFLVSARNVKTVFANQDPSLTQISRQNIDPIRKTLIFTVINTLPNPYGQSPYPILDENDQLKYVPAGHSYAFKGELSIDPYHPDVILNAMCPKLVPTIGGQKCTDWEISLVDGKGKVNKKLLSVYDANYSIGFDKNNAYIVIGRAGNTIFPVDTGTYMFNLPTN